MLKVFSLELKVSVHFFLSILNNTKLRAVQYSLKESFTKAWCLGGNLAMFSRNKQKLATHFVDMNDTKQEGKWSGKDKVELEEIKGIYHDVPVPISKGRSQWSCINFDIWTLELSLSLQLSPMFHFHYWYSLRLDRGFDIEYLVRLSSFTLTVSEPETKCYDFKF